MSWAMVRSSTAETGQWFLWPRRVMGLVHVLRVAGRIQGVWSALWADRHFTRPRAETAVQCRRTNSTSAVGSLSVGQCWCRRLTLYLHICLCPVLRFLHLKGLSSLTALTFEVYHMFKILCVGRFNLACGRSSNHACVSEAYVVLRRPLEPRAFSGVGLFG